MPTDPRLAGNAFGITDPVMAQLAAMRQEVADLRREVRDLRAAATIQIGSASPVGFSARIGTPYGRSSDTSFWIDFPTGWRGIALPLTS